MNTRRHWVVVLGDAEGLRWVIENNTMAFTEVRCGAAHQIRSGDDVVLYVTRGAFHNPTRDEAQVVGLMSAGSGAQALEPPLMLADRKFSCAVKLKPILMLPERQGVPVRPLVRRLRLVKRPEVWGQYFRSSLMKVDDHDFGLLSGAVRKAAGQKP